jgi:hypothetical protein
VPATTFPSEIAIGSAQDLLARLERYAAARRAAVVAPAGAAPTIAPVARCLVAARPNAHPLRIGAAQLDAATIDLFPYDLAATIVGCAAVILASIAVALPLALLFTVGLAATGEWARRNRWFPSVATNLLIGTAIGIVLVVIS